MLACCVACNGDQGICYLNLCFYLFMNDWYWKLNEKTHTLFLLFRDSLLTLVNILGGLFKCRFMLGELKSENSSGSLLRNRWGETEMTAQGRLVWVFLIYVFMIKAYVLLNFIYIYIYKSVKPHIYVCVYIYMRFYTFTSFSLNTKCVIKVTWQSYFINFINFVFIYIHTLLLCYWFI